MEKLELAGEAEDEVLDDDWFCTLLDVRKQGEQLFVAATQQEDVRLDDISQIDQHDLVVLLLPTSGVNTDGRYVSLAAALDEVAVGSKLVELIGFLRYVGWDLELVCELAHELLSLPETALTGFTRTGTGDAPEGQATSGRANATLVGREITTMDHGSTVG